MPYIVTTKRPIPHESGWEGASLVSRRAVATLEEARERVDDHVADLYYAEFPPDRGEELPQPYFDFSEQARHLPESGGTVGPLPDGTVFEVSGDLDWGALMLGAGIDPYDTRSYTEPEIIDAYNARERS